MIRQLLFLLAFLVAATAYAQRPGDDSTNFVLINDLGEVTQLSDYNGTPLILNFWASWCAPCVEELPFFERIYDELNEGQDEPALNVLLVNNNEDFDKASSFLRDELGIELDVVLDAPKDIRASLEAEGIKLDKTLEVIRSYRVRGMPSTFFIDADGVIQAVKQGFLLQSEAPALLASIGLEWQP